MPSFSNSAGTKFQLPALDLKFGSLTEGTDIPPPLPSPIQEEPSDLQKPVDSLAKPTATNNGTQTTPEVHRNGVKRSADQAITPGSPVSTKGPASIRRLFSRNRLNEAVYANGGPTTGDSASMFPRPVSQSNASIATDGQPKRTSGWFRRLRGSDGGESRRSSRIFVSAENTKPLAAIVNKPSGPPPPKLPEFKSLGSKVDLGDDGGSLGSDLFKDIK
ncbi:hypothetical protein N0V93_009787 [Gnomoniopsis smithogilvyi]|uniref:Uncharacterized protein n=1 Tax=Gnomoniopsis smithogilvyi TaxID=1191159 RepID=A0A9W8YLH9_9PEZI|nr:hypothetical protein N0V93_009787 [Gnomoniopsis smithogilvyi]